MRSFSRIESLARKALGEIRTPPVDVEKIAELHGAVVKFDQFDDGVSGALYRADSGPIIGVNVEHTENRQRFTIAHEIGHLLLGHEEELIVDHHYVGESKQAASAAIKRLHRDTISSQAIDPQEIEANRFAAALLMPARFLEDSLAEHRGPVGEKEIERLATEYAVSRQAMLFRLMNLGVPVDPA